MHDEGTFLVSEYSRLYEVKNGQRDLLIEADPGYQLLHVAVSPDGSRLAYTLFTPSRQTPNGVDFGSDLYVADRDGSNPRMVLEHAAPAEYIQSPQWLADDVVLFDIRGPTVDGSYYFRIEALELASGTRSLVLDEAILPSLSPDRAKIAAVRLPGESPYDDIVIYDLATGQVDSVLGESSTKVYISAIAWSPDGTELAFASADPFTMLPGGGRNGAVFVATHPTEQDIWLIGTGGRNLRLLADLGDSRPSLSWPADDRLYSLGRVGFFRIDPRTGAKQQIGAGIYGGQVVALP